MDIAKVTEGVTAARRFDADTAATAMVHCRVPLQMREALLEVARAEGQPVSRIMRQMWVDGLQRRLNIQRIEADIT